MRISNDSRWKVLLVVVGWRHGAVSPWLPTGLQGLFLQTNRVRGSITFIETIPHLPDGRIRRRLSFDLSSCVSMT